MKKKTVITYGTFDVIHIGHLKLLERAKALGDRLIVAVSSDQFNISKHKTSLLDYENRCAVVESLRFVDMVIKEETWEQKVSDIRKYNVDVFVIGDDWAGSFDHLSEYCEVVYVPRTDGISSTAIRNGELKGQPKK